MPICRDCGLGVPPAYDTCPKCGRELVSVASAAAEQTAPAPAAPVTREPPAVPSEDYQSFFVRATATPTTTTAPAPPPLGFNENACSVCGRVPAVRLSLRRHMGLIWIIRFARLEAMFCRDHGVAAASEYLRRTLIEAGGGS